mmetsp:Transcript_9413/g.9293  ORF Transcript_9413/g.9293 Transcript_9413/m.9293 type:complete len:215 (+) Transcript_9413:2157-2801(+)
MLSFNNFRNNFFNDLFFNHGNISKSRIKSRGPEHKVSKSLQPRRDMTSKPKRDDLMLTLFIDDDFFGGELNLFENTNRFFDKQARFDVQEDDENYLVSYKDTDIKNKELDVKYLKDKQEIVISSKIKKCDKYDDGNGISEFSSTSESRIRLDKPVNHEATKATIDNDCLKLTIPKLESDETIFRIEIEDEKENKEEKEMVDPPVVIEPNEHSNE